MTLQRTQKTERLPSARFLSIGFSWLLRNPDAQGTALLLHNQWQEQLLRQDALSF
jgi:hypothetical protein